jgi:isochorismate synthase EntC
MQAFDGFVALYLGGGLTGNSDPDAEWLETELKAKTLLSVL